MSAFSFIPWKSSGGSGGPDLSGITAGGDQILAGYQSVDRNGDVVYGSIIPANIDPVFTDSAESLEGPEVLAVELPQTGYYLNGYAGGFGLWVSWSDLASAIGLTPQKLKSGVTVIGVTGV